MQQKLPAFQFYPGDWRKNIGIQSLDYHTRGIWFELLCLMHESERRGVLLLGSRPMPAKALANLLGLTVPEVNRAIRKLEQYGVSGRESGTGALISRRMIRDEQLRQVRAESGHLGGTARGDNQTASKTQASANQISKQTAPPSASASVSASASASPPIHSSTTSPGTSAPSNSSPGGVPPKEGKDERGDGRKAASRQPLLDALAGVDGSDPRQVPQSAWRGIAKVLADIQTVCPTVDVDEVERRAKNYRSHMPKVRISPFALAKHWALCAQANQNGNDDNSHGRAPFA